MRSVSGISLEVTYPMVAGFVASLSRNDPFCRQAGAQLRIPSTATAALLVGTSRHRRSHGAGFSPTWLDVVMPSGAYRWGGWFHPSKRVHTRMMTDRHPAGAGASVSYR